MAIKLKDITKNYEDLRVISNFSMDIEEGKILCIVGPSGCGKSTLLNLVAGTLDIDGGEIDLNKNTLGYVFQEDRLLPWRTVTENIAIVGEKIKNREKKEIKDLIDSVGLNGFENSYPDELSGGMKQRVSIARGFYYKADLLLMDEPFKSLDPDLRVKMIHYLLNLWEKTRNTIIFVTHSIDEALLLGHKIIVLSKCPASITETFTIEKQHGQRDIAHEDMMKMHTKIMSIITKVNKEDY